jgi:DNA-binding beta-propeller fold protein YncE
LANNATKITPNGTSTILGTTDINPFWMAIDKNGNIYTTNHEANTVSKITTR